MMSGQHKCIRTLLLCLPLTLLGCAQAYGPKFQPQKIEPDKSLVYLYRKGSFSSAILAMSPMIMINGEPYRTLKPRGHVAILLAPGRYEISLHAAHFGRVTGGELASVNFHAEQGEIDYLRYEVVTTAVHSRGNAQWAEVQPLLFFEGSSRGIQDLQKTRLLSTDNNLSMISFFLVRTSSESFFGSVLRTKGPLPRSLKSRLNHLLNFGSLLEVV